MAQVEASQFSCYVDKANLEFAVIFPSAEIAGVLLHTSEKPLTETTGLLLPNHGYLLCIIVYGASFCLQPLI